MSKPCDHCNGSGQEFTKPWASSCDPTNDTIDCTACDGAGEIEDAE